MKWFKNNYIALTLIVFTILIAWILNSQYLKTYQRFNYDGTTFIKGKVIEIVKNDLEYDFTLKTYKGSQEVIVEVYGNEQIELTNYVTYTHNIKLSKGSKIILNVSEAEGVDAHYTVYNYDRTSRIFILSIVLFLVVIAIGKKKGLKALIGLGYTLFCVIYILLPAIFSGGSPIAISVGCAVLSSVVTLLLLNGQSKKTLAAILSTILGVVISSIVFQVMAYILNINGFSSSEAESLILISRSTGLQIKDVMFAGIIISSLGAVMDVAMSIISSLYEIRKHKKTVSEKELFVSGMDIGKDLIGTMTNTLILAFTGSSLITLLALLSYQDNMLQLMNSNFVAIEIIQGLSATVGIVLTIPAAAYIGSQYIK